MKPIYFLLISSILVGGVVLYLYKVGFHMYYYAQAPNNRVIMIGQIFGIMESGNAYAIKSTTDSRFPEIAAFYSDEQPAKEILDGEVFISGKIDSVDCEAYRSIFKGCVPWVEIEEIEQLEK